MKIYLDKIYNLFFKNDKKKISFKELDIMIRTTHSVSDVGVTKDNIFFNSISSQLENYKKSVRISSSLYEEKNVSVVVLTRSDWDYVDLNHSSKAHLGQLDTLRGRSGPILATPSTLEYLVSQAAQIENKYQELQTSSQEFMLVVLALRDLDTIFNLVKNHKRKSCCLH